MVILAFELKTQKKVGSKSSENGCVAQTDQPNRNKLKSDRKMRSNDFEQGYYVINNHHHVLQIYNVIIKCDVIYVM